MLGKLLENKIVLLFISLIILGSIISIIVMIWHYLGSMFHSKSTNNALVSNSINAVNKANIAINSAKNAENTARLALNSANKANNQANVANKNANIAASSANVANKNAGKALNVNTYANSSFHGTSAGGKLSMSNSNTQKGVKPRYWEKIKDTSGLPRPAMESGNPWRQKLSNWPVEGVIYEGFNPGAKSGSKTGRTFSA